MRNLIALISGLLFGVGSAWIFVIAMLMGMAILDRLLAAR